MDNSLQFNSNLFDEERSKIFGKIYLANVRNRLRELENPNDVDCKRWIWELVQNAKDSISNQPDRKDVDIKLINEILITMYGGALEAFLTKRSDADFDSVIKTGFNLIYEGIKKKGENK